MTPFPFLDSVITRRDMILEHALALVDQPTIGMRLLAHRLLNNLFSELRTRGTIDVAALLSSYSTRDHEFAHPTVVRRLIVTFCRLIAEESREVDAERAAFAHVLMEAVDEITMCEYAAQDNLNAPAS